MERFFGLVTRRAHLVLAVILSITTFFAFQLHKLHVDTSLMQMLVEDLPAKEDYDRYKEDFGWAADDILVVLKAEDIFSPESFEKIVKLTQALGSVEGVKRVVSLSTLKDDIDILGEWTLEDLKHNLTLADIFVGNVISADGKATALIVVLQDDYQIGPTSEAIEEVLQPFRDTADPLQIYQIGSPVIGHALTKYTERDCETLPYITMLVIFVVLALCFRSLPGALVPFAAVCLTLVWTFGLMGLLDISLSMVTMIIPTLLIAVGSAYAMHIMAAYFDEATRQDTQNEAVVRGLTRVCLPTILASATTIVGFASLLLNKIEIIREFAIFSCLGLLFMLIIHLTFIPSVLSLLQMRGATRVFDSQKGSWIETFLAKIVSITHQYPKAILVLYLVVALVAGAGLARIRVETTPINYFKETAPIKMAFKDVYQNLSGVYPLNVVLRSGLPGYFSSPEVLHQVEALQGFLGEMEGVDLSVSVVDLLKLEGLASRGFKAKQDHYVLPNDSFIVQEAIRNFRMLQGDEAVNYFVSKDFSRINVTCRTHIVSTTDFIKVEQRILDYLREHFPEDLAFDVTGLTIVVSHSSETVTMGQVKSLSVALVCIFVLLSVLFVSPKVGFYAMLPNFFPILVNFGVMGWFGIQLSVATSLIASIAIGLSVDDTIHYVFRFNRELKKDLSRRQAMSRTTAAVGKPIVFTSLTVGLGFSVLLFSSFIPTIIFGFLMVVTVASALIGDLFILPAVLLQIQLVTLWDLLKLKLGKDPQKGIPLFDGLSRSQVHYILMAGATRDLDSGDVLFQKGETSDSMYAVISGELEVVDVMDDTDEHSIHGIRKHIATLRTGHVVGEMGMVRRCQRSATVIATTPAELLEINDRMIKRLQWLYPPTGQRFFFNLMAGICDRLEATTDRLSQVTTTDALTGLNSRHYFLNVLEKEIARTRRYEALLSLLMVDVDRFGDINSTYGHETGDRILSDLGRAIVRNMRQSDVACRFGGQQFAVLLPNSSAANASMVCERLRRLVDEHPFQSHSSSVHITVSIGFATLGPDRKEVAVDLMGEATQALQRAKESGRNRVEG